MGLYAAYTWTAGPGGSTLQVARFYVPALGPISLLGAWLVTRVPRRESLPAVTALAAAASVAVMFFFGVRAFNDMTASPFGGAVKVVHSCGPLRGTVGRPGLNQRIGPGRPQGVRGQAVCVGGKPG